jgi:hypothetical protein
MDEAFGFVFFIGQGCDIAARSFLGRIGFFSA